MSAPTAVIAEDEPILRAQLKELLGTVWPGLNVVALAADGSQAMCALERHQPDVLFLDIQMPGLSGLDVARQANGRCHVVFVTAYNEHALAAFEQGAVDYVLKPYSLARLATTVGRLRQRIGQTPVAVSAVLDVIAPRAAAPAEPPMRWIKALQGDTIKLITVAEVFYFQADHKYTLVVTATGEAVIRLSVAELCARLDPEQFWQVHRGTIVNVNEIARVQRHASGRLELHLKHHPAVLRVSETHTALFRHM